MEQMKKARKNLKIQFATGDVKRAKIKEIWFGEIVRAVAEKSLNVNVVWPSGLGLALGT